MMTLVRRLRTMTGLDLADEDVARAADRRMRAHGMAVRAEYAAFATQHPEELEALLELLVVPETWFFRDADAFDAAVDVVRTKLARRDGPARILSVPCASGEEPYSMAIALRDAGIAPDHFRIEGVDISARAVELAVRAEYRRNAFRSPDLAFVDRHFDKLPQSFLLHDDIRTLVEFRKGNLFDPAGFQAGYDIIFCRNLLIYFDAESQNKAIERLRSVLAPDGVLFTGYAEAPCFLQRGFEAAPYRMAFAVQIRRDATAPEPKQRVPLLQDIPAKAAAWTFPDASRERTEPGSPSVSAPSIEEGRRLADAGLIDEATTMFDSYLEDHPDSVEACFMLGLLHERKRNLDAAERFLRRAVYLDPHHYDALCHLALLAEGRGKPDVASSFRQRAARVWQRLRPAHERSGR